MTLTIEALGISKEEAVERVIRNITSQLITGEDEDEYGDTYPVKTAFARGVQAAVQERIDVEVLRIADEHITPRIGELIDGVTFQKTNQWGEPKQEPLTFREYLVQQAEKYMIEPVDYQGKPKGTDSFSWNARGTRVAHMVHEHLHYHIEQAMKAALADLNSKVAGGLHEATKIALSEVLSKLKVEVKTK